MTQPAEKTISFIAACKRFFGMQPGQTLTQFGEELRQLTDADRAEMLPQLAEALGVTVVLTK